MQEASQTIGLPESTLLLDGLFVSGGDIILRGEFKQVTIRCCTLDPGSRDGAGAGAGNRPVRREQLRAALRVGTRHRDVAQDELKLFRAQEFERRLSRGHLSAIVVVAQQFVQHLSDLRLVVRDQDACTRCLCVGRHI